MFREFLSPREFLVARWRYRELIVLVVAIAATARSCLAQDALANTARQQAENYGKPVSSAAPHVDANGTALPDDASDADKQADADLGEQWIMKGNERPQRFSIFGDVSAFYTNNVALANTNEATDSFLVVTVGGSYNRPLWNPFTLNISIYESVFRYDRFSGLNFDSFNVGVGMSLPVKQLWDANINLQYNFSHLSQDFASTQLFSGHSFSLSASKTIPFSPADSLSFGIVGAYNLADPSSLERADLSMFAGYSLALSRHLSLTVSYRASGFRYPNTDRSDFNQNVAAGLRFDVNRWFSISASTSGTFNNSNQRPFDYSAFTIGGGITATIRF